ncbi:hypothetical protein QIS12_gp3 [ssRNA phage SRR6960509_15]|uniref:Uncharacterized protein n=1 Tax=ssRNA phage SRR6960509_15 TaxID=2786526 RepID=A0A8S5L5D3_9VIRU|nr:hypothetical protein QIS12_gp3 [ssRNA phage SRR6960509_15]DAD52567.1 TPA_asm: hypothetical protein [ssRNA phage SRR6960509_15]
MKWVVFFTTIMPSVLDVISQIAVAFSQTKKSDSGKIDEEGFKRILPRRSC